VPLAQAYKHLKVSKLISRKNNKLALQPSRSGPLAGREKAPKNSKNPDDGMQTVQLLPSETAHSKKNQTPLIATFVTPKNANLKATNSRHETHRQLKKDYQRQASKMIKLFIPQQTSNEAALFPVQLKSQPTAGGFSRT
jgi:hypothetical protein